MKRLPVSAHAIAMRGRAVVRRRTAPAFRARHSARRRPAFTFGISARQFYHTSSPRQKRKTTRFIWRILFCQLVIAMILSYAVAIISPAILLPLIFSRDTRPSAVIIYQLLAPPEDHRHFRRAYRQAAYLVSMFTRQCLLPDAKGHFRGKKLM